AIGIALTLVLGWTAGACGSSDDDPEDVRAELIEQLRSDDQGFSKAQSECFADVLIDEVGADELADIDFSESEPPEELQGAFGRAAIKAVADCKIPIPGQ